MFLIKLLQTGKMNKENFTKYATDFSLLDEKSLDEIKAILDEFPHFQSAWILYAKNLHKLKDVRFENKLKLAATYVPDRRILKRLLNDTYKPFEKEIYTLKETIVEIPIVSTVEPKKEEVAKEEIKIEPEVILETPKEEEALVNIEKLEEETIEAKIEIPFVNPVEQKKEEVAKEEIKIEPEVIPETPKEKTLVNNEKPEEKTVETLSIADQILNNINKIKQERVAKGEEYRARSKEQRANLTENIVQKEEIETPKSETINKKLVPSFPPPYVFEKKEKEEVELECLGEKIEPEPNTKESTAILETPKSETINKKFTPSFPPPYVFEKEEKPEISTKEIKTKPSGSAADRILKTISDIREGTNTETTSSPAIVDSSDDLQAIIAQRLAELGKKNDTPSIKPKEEPQKVKDVITETPKLEKKDVDVLDFEQITGISPDKNSQKDIKKPEINSKDYINFDFGVTEKPNIEPKIEENEDVIEKIIEINSEKKAQLIDKFLASNPRIKPDKEYTSNGSVSTSIGVSENEELFSETLAKIYIKQKHFDKAILTYEKLCLKYPEKNIYFAGQIEKIKNLIKNKD